MIGIRDMYVATRNIPSFGIQGYKAQKKYESNTKVLKDSSTDNKKKSQTKRGCYIDDYMKIHQAIPGPCDYDKQKQKKSKSNKKIKYSNKKTYIDQIMQRQKKQKLPAPGQYKLFKDDKQIKQQKKKLANKKVNHSQRITYLDAVQYEATTTPGVGQYKPLLRPISASFAKKQIRHTQRPLTAKNKKNKEPSVGSYNPKILDQPKSFARKSKGYHQWGHTERFGRQIKQNKLGPGAYFNQQSQKVIKNRAKSVYYHMKDSLQTMPSRRLTSLNKKRQTNTNQYQLESPTKHLSQQHSLFYSKDQQQKNKKKTSWKKSYLNIIGKDQIEANNEIQIKKHLKIPQYKSIEKHNNQKYQNRIIGLTYDNQPVRIQTNYIQSKSRGSQSFIAGTNNNHLEEVMQRIPKDDFVNPFSQQINQANKLTLTRVAINTSQLNQNQQNDGSDRFFFVQNHKIDNLAQSTMTNKLFEIQSRTLKKESMKKLSQSDDDIFQIPQLKNSKKQSMMSDPDQSSDDSDLFDLGEKQTKNNVIYKSNSQDFALQKILQASKIYDRYLLRNNIKQLQRNSIDLPHQLSMKDYQELPKQFFFRPERIQFKKPESSFMPNDYGSYSNSNLTIICKVSKDRTRLYYQDLKIQHISYLNGHKCNQMVFPQSLKIGRVCQYDQINKRFYIFSNFQQKIHVYSGTSNQLLCKIQLQKKVFDPLLLIHRVNQRIFLLVLGGYTRMQKNLVQGNKFVQIFEIRPWQITDLKSKIIKLVIGRIRPIVFSFKQKQKSKIAILGGNTIALKLKNLDKLQYNSQKDINQSTNLTGVIIPSQQIIQLFDFQQPVMYSNISVRIMNPFSLHSGVVVSVTNAHLLLLPGSRNLFQIKIYNKEITIIQGNRYDYFPALKQYQRRQCTVRIVDNMITMYRINLEGYLDIMAQSDHKGQKKCPCQIY